MGKRLTPTDIGFVNAWAEEFSSDGPTKPRHRKVFDEGIERVRSTNDGELHSVVADEILTTAMFVEDHPGEVLFVDECQSLLAAADAVLTANGSHDLTGQWDDLILTTALEQLGRRRWERQWVERARDLDTGTDVKAMIDRRHWGVEFPMDALPVPFREFITAVCAAISVDPVLVVGPALAALGAATAGGFKVTNTGRADWEIRLCLWVIVSAVASEGKSPVNDLVSRGPLNAAFAKIADATRDARLDAEARLEVATREVKAAKSLKSDSTADDMREAQDEERAAQAALSELRVPRFIVTDATPEAIEMRMRSNHGITAVVAAEGSFIEIIAGQYKTGRSSSLGLGNLNESWSGGALNTSRVTRGDTDIPHTQLTFSILAQPEVIGALAQPGFSRTGFLARVLFALPPTLVGRRPFPTDTVARRLTAWWDDLIHDTLKAGWGNIATPHSLTLTEPAREAIERFHDEVSEPRAGGERSPVEGWWGKSDEHVLRIAGLLHLLKGLTHGHGITADTIEAAARIVVFYGDQMGALHRDVIATDTTGQGNTYRDKVLTWIKAHHPDPDDGFTTAMVRRGCKPGEGRPSAEIEVINTVLEDLVEDGWVQYDGQSRSNSWAWSATAKLAETAVEMYT